MTELKREIHRNTIIIGNSNTPLPIMDRIPRKINKETKDLNKTKDQMDTETMEYIFFSRAHTPFSRKNNMIGHRKRVLTNLRLNTTKYFF